MKRMISAMFCFVLMTQIASAEEAVNQSRANPSNTLERPQIGLIPTAGLSVFSATGVSGSGQSLSSTTGFIGGLLGDINTSWSKLQFETGVLFMQEGDSISKSGFTRTSDYLGVPLTVKVRPFSKFSVLDFDGGIIPSLLVAAKTETGHGVQRNAYSRMTPYDIQATVGAGLSFPIGNGLSLTGRVSLVHGLVSFLNNGTAIYNEGVTVTTGLIF